MDGVLFPFEVGGERKVVGVGGKEDICRPALAESVWMGRDRSGEVKSKGSGGGRRHTLVPVETLTRADASYLSGRCQQAEGVIVIRERSLLRDRGDCSEN